MANVKIRNGETLFHCFNEIEKYTCTACPNFQTNSLTKLRIHTNEGHGDENLDENVYKCLKCVFVTNSTYLMGRHSLFSECPTDGKAEQRKRFLTCYQTNTEPKTTTCEKSEINQIQCDQCTSKFKQKLYLKRHIASHHAKPEDIQWFQCDQCSYKCKNKWYLKTHFKARHTDPEDIDWHQCEQCSSKFKRSRDLLRHIKTIHANPEDIDWHQCEQCSSKFKLRFNLLTHLRLVHAKPEDIKWFKCNRCGLKFKKNSCLKVHIKKCHAT